MKYLRELTLEIVEVDCWKTPSRGIAVLKNSIIKSEYLTSVSAFSNSVEQISSKLRLFQRLLIIGFSQRYLVYFSTTFSSYHFESSSKDSISPTTHRNWFKPAPCYSYIQITSSNNISQRVMRKRVVKGDGKPQRASLLFNGIVGHWKNVLDSAIQLFNTFPSYSFNGYLGNL